MKEMYTITYRTNYGTNAITYRNSYKVAKDFMLYLANSGNFNIICYKSNNKEKSRIIQYKVIYKDKYGKNFINVEYKISGHNIKENVISSLIKKGYSDVKYYETDHKMYVSRKKSRSRKPYLWGYLI